MVLFCLVAAYVIVRAWEQARAQAGAEWRRAREHVAGEFAARMAAGEASGPWDSWWWWAAETRRAWRATRGARQGARNTALPGRSPWRRVAQAARAGAARGAAEGARRASERRRARRDARTAAGGGRGSRGARWAASGAWFAAGWAAGRAGWWRWRPVQFVAVGVCDDCGAVCALPSMAYQRVDIGGRTETWLLCAACRAGRTPGPAPAPVPLAVQVSAAVTVGHASDGPLALQPGTVPAAGAAAESAGDSGGITSGGPAAPEPALAEAGSTGPVAALPADDESAGLPPSAPLPEPSRTETSTDGGQMSNELELAGGSRLPVPAGESYNYGAWQRATVSDAELLDALGLALEAMLADLTAVSAGRTQVQNVTAWADRVAAEAGLTREAIDEMDRRYRPVIATVAAAGGPDEVSNTSYYREM